MTREPVLADATVLAIGLGSLLYGFFGADGFHVDAFQLIFDRGFGLLALTPLLVFAAVGLPRVLARRDSRPDAIASLLLVLMSFGAILDREGREAEADRVRRRAGLAAPSPRLTALAAGLAAQIQRRTAPRGSSTTSRSAGTSRSCVAPTCSRST